MGCGRRWWLKNPQGASQSDAVAAGHLAAANRAAQAGTRQSFHSCDAARGNPSNASLGDRAGRTGACTKTIAAIQILNVACPKRTELIQAPKMGLTSWPAFSPADLKTHMASVALDSILTRSWGIYCDQDLKLIIFSPPKCASTAAAQPSMQRKIKTIRIYLADISHEYLPELCVHQHVRSHLCPICLSSYAALPAPVRKKF